MENIANINSKSVSLTVTTVTGNVALDSKGGANVIVVNNGDEIAYVCSGSSTVTATTANFPIPPGAAFSLKKDPAHTHVAAITATGTTPIAIVETDGV